MTALVECGSCVYLDGETTEVREGNTREPPNIACLGKEQSYLERLVLAEGRRKEGCLELNGPFSQRLYMRYGSE